MATYEFDFYLVSPYSAGFVASVGASFVYTGPATAEGTMTLTDTEAGGEGMVLDDNVANDQELAVATLNNGTTTYTDVPISADAAWTLYDPIEDRTFEVVLLSVDVPKGGSLSYLLSEYPLVAGRTYEVVAFHNQPDYGSGTPVFTYEDYVCFAAGTRVETPDGWRAVEELAPGDLVCTRDDGPQPIRWVGSARVGALGEAAPIRIAPGVFGNARPLLVSPRHRILLQGWQVSLVTGADEVLVAAKDLVGLPGVAVCRRLFVDYFHILLDRHAVLNAEGVRAESFHPGQMSEEYLSPSDITEIVALFPALATSFEAYGPAARMTLRKPEARLIVKMIADEGARSGHMVA